MAEVSGKFRFQTTILSDYPAVGNFVLVNWNESGNSSIIESLLPRKSAFIRKAAGEPQQEQIVAANIDTVFLCMALNHDFNLRRLERYISIAWDSGAMPVVVLTKSDLCDDLEQKLSEVSSVAFGVDVLVTTSTEENGYKVLLPFISEGKTIAFIESSGVGKSTLINRLLGKDQLKTNGLRNDDKGRHTTTHRELFLLPSGGMVVDTPGMREFGMWDNDTGIIEIIQQFSSVLCAFWTGFGKYPFPWPGVQRFSPNLWLGYGYRAIQSIRKSKLPGPEVEQQELNTGKSARGAFLPDRSMVQWSK